MPETRGRPDDPGLSLEDQAEAFARTVLAGHPQGSVRRIVLYLVEVVALLTAVSFGGALGLLFAIIAVVAALLLALTDQLL